MVWFREFKFARFYLTTMQATCAVVTVIPIPKLQNIHNDSVNDVIMS